MPADQVQFDGDNESDEDSDNDGLGAALIYGR